MLVFLVVLLLRFINPQATYSVLVRLLLLTGQLLSDLLIDECSQFGVSHQAGELTGLVQGLLDRLRKRLDLCSEADRGSGPL